MPEFIELRWYFTYWITNKHDFFYWIPNSGPPHLTLQSYCWMRKKNSWGSETQTKKFGEGGGKKKCSWSSETHTIVHIFILFGGGGVFGAPHVPTQGSLGRAGSENDTLLPLTMTRNRSKFWNGPAWRSKVIIRKPCPGLGGLGGGRIKNKNKINIDKSDPRQSKISSWLAKRSPELHATVPVGSVAKSSCCVGATLLVWVSECWLLCWCGAFLNSYIIAHNMNISMDKT